MSILEKLKALFDAADQGKWTDLGRFHSIAFGVSESDEAIGNVFGIGPKADANINLICQTQNMMPEILADLERLQKLETNIATATIDLNPLRTAFEASTKEGYIDSSTDWLLRGNDVMCGNSFVANVLVDGDNDVTRRERLAIAEFIILAHNMMPEILSNLDRVQLLESELDRVKAQGIKLKKAFDSSTEAASLMREQIEQMRGMFNDEDEAIQNACDAHDTFQDLVFDLFKPESA